MDRIVSLLLVVTIDWLVRLTQYFETYIFQDWGFVQYLIIPVLVDTLLGVYIAKKKNNFSWKELDKIVDKLISYVSILVLVHVMTSFTVDNETVTLFHWMRVSVFSGLMAKEGYSILKNLSALNNSYVPTWLLNKFKQFDKTGKFSNEKDDKADE